MFVSDSVIYIHRSGDPVVETGDYLGQLTDEVADYGPGARITECVMLGPKNYAYTVTSGDGSTDTVMKIKGMSLHAKSLGEIGGIAGLKAIADAYVASDKSKRIVKPIPQHRITVNNRFKQQVQSVSFDKKLKATASKRRIVGNNTLPYGYAGIDDPDTTEDEIEANSNLIAFLNALDFNDDD